MLQQKSKNLPVQSSVCSWFSSKNPSFHPHFHQNQEGLLAKLIHFLQRDIIRAVLKSKSHKSYFMLLIKRKREREKKTSYFLIFLKQTKMSPILFAKTKTSSLCQIFFWPKVARLASSASAVLI